MENNAIKQMLGTVLDCTQSESSHKKKYSSLNQIQTS